MNRFFSSTDAKKVEELTEIRKQNNEACWLLCDYLNVNPRFITPEIMESVTSGERDLEEHMFFALLVGACGLNIENSDKDRKLANSYFRRCVKKLSPEKYLENPYYKNIKIPEATFGRWRLTYEKYEPFEAFIYDDITLENNFTELPHLGFFSTQFLFPAVMEEQHEWMAIKPNEVETMQPSIDMVEGNVVAFGLGLGYFAYMASLKPNVSSVTVVERDKEAIELFTRFILPQFEYKEKVRIVPCDAFLYMNNRMAQGQYDYAFVDLWHDVADGLPIYLKVKKLECAIPHTKFLYWIESSLLSALRWQVYDLVVQNARSYQQVVNGLGVDALRRLAALRVSLE